MSGDKSAERDLSRMTEAEVREELARVREEIASLRIHRAIVENAWAVHWVVDEKGLVTFSSQTQAAMGLPAFNGVGTTSLFDVVSSELQPRLRQCVEQALATPGVPAFTELRGRTRAGVWAEREVVAISRLDHPILKGVVVTSTDIGPRNAARHQLRAAYERHALAAEAGNDLIWEWEPSTDLSTSTFVSAFVRSETRTSGEVLAHVHEDDRDRVRTALLAQANGTPMDIEWRMIRDGKEPRWHRSVAALAVDSQGKSRVVGRTTDIHARKLTEIALQDSERRYRALFASTSAAVTLRDVNTLQLIDCNDAALRLFGARTREELFATTPADLAVPVQPGGQTATARLQEALAIAEREGSVRYDWTARRLTGETFIAEFLISRIELDDRAVYQTIIEDVTEQRRNVEALAKAKEDALAGMRAKSAFLAAMSHELRSPLAGVIGMIELLTNGPLDARQRRYADLARTSARGLLSVINDVLDFSKFEAGGLEIAAESLCLQDVVDDAISVFATRADEKGVFLFCESPLLPRVIGDPGRLRQVLVNLIGNAIKFTSAGEIGVHVSVAEREEGARVLRLRVSDTGAGIAASDLERIFVPFASVESAQPGHGGTGLGLAISRELTTRMGGTLTVESEPGVGSRFTVTLKLQLAPGEDDARGERSTEDVLVVAGDERQRAALSASLALRGHASDAADSVAAMAACMKRRTYAILMIVDDPPRFDGRAAATVASGIMDGRTRLIYLESLRNPFTDEEAAQLQISARCPSPFWNAKLDAALQGGLAPTAAREEMVRAPSGACVLVVDDSPVNAEVAARVLGNAGYRVDIADTGEEAVAILLRRSYDAVLLDCRLPGIDGYETARQMRALEREGRSLGTSPMSIIALTATSTSGDVARAAEAGMNAHISKPFDSAHLLRVLAGQLRGTVQPGAPAATARPASGAGLLNLDGALARLGGDSGALGRAVRRFIELAPESFDLLSGAASRRDWHALEYAAHRLRGQALTFDASTLVTAVAKVERAARAQDWTETQDAVARTREVLSAVLRELAENGEATVPR